MVEKPGDEISQKNRLIAIVGPTASGKTNRAVCLCRSINGEIISGDSRQVYKGMDIGTGKDLDEYDGIPYHLIDICEAGDKYNLHRYITDFHRVLKNIGKRGKNGVLCGGTGMYIESVLSGIVLPEVPENKKLRENLDERSLEELTEILKGYKNLHNTTDIDTTKRAIRAIEIEEYYRQHPEMALKANRQKAIPLQCLIIGMDIPRDDRRKRISQRLFDRLRQGMVEEVEGLMKGGLTPEQLIYYGLEYKFVTLYLIGRISYDEMVRQLEIAIHQFAKRQMTWFRGMEKRGFKIHWLPYNLPDSDFLETCNNLMISNSHG